MYKVCHITSVHDQGDVRIFEKECTSLAKRDDFDVYLVAAGESRTQNGVKIIGAGTRPRGRIRRATGFASRIVDTAVGLGAAVYHFHDPEFVLYAKRLKATGAKIIFDSHEDNYTQILYKPYIPVAVRKPAATAYRRHENKALKYIDAVIFPCMISGRHPFEGRAKRYIFIDNLPIIGDVSERELTDEMRRTVCCVGSLTEARGTTQLVEACRRAGVKLILAGNISPPEYKERLTTDDIFSHVDYRGYCDRSQVERIYSVSGIGASTIQRVGQYPIIYNLPTKVYEFMSMAIPFVVSDFDFARRVTEEYDCGIAVDPADIDAIAAAIKTLADNPSRAGEMGRNGRKAAEERFNWAIEEKKLYDLYDELLGI